VPSSVSYLLMHRIVTVPSCANCAMVDEMSKRTPEQVNYRSIDWLPLWILNERKVFRVQNNSLLHRCSL
jgi:hypothetical protein